MPDGYARHEIIAIAGGVLVLTVLTIWRTIYFLSVVVIGERDEPLARAGGLKPSRQFSPSNGAKSPGWLMTRPSLGVPP